MSSSFPGVGDRLVQRLRALGYWQAKKNRPDLMRFSRERHWHPATYLYEWCFKEVVPALPSLKRLGKDLDVPYAWLLLGSEAIEDVKAHLPTLERKLRAGARGQVRALRRS